MLSGKTEVERNMARELEQKFDGPVFYTPSGVNSLINRTGQIYIFSLFPQEKKVAKGSLGTFRIPACPRGARHSASLKLGAVVSSSYFDAATQSMKTDDVAGEYIAQDIVHPFIGGDWSTGQNLDDLGIFWTRNEVPTDEEVQRAQARLEATYRKALAQATSLETTGQLEFITPIMRLAAAHYNENRPWNRIYQKLADCPGCGAEVKPGIIKHNCGYIFDPKRAFEAGMIDKDTFDQIAKVRGSRRGKGKEADELESSS